MTENGDFPNERKRWLETTYAKAKERGGECKDTDFRTSSAEVQPMYTPADVADIDYNRDIGYPGEYPYTRGCRRTCTAGGCGPSASMLATERRRRRTSASSSS